MRLKRPGPIRWLWYAFGGTMPDAYRQWVLFDLTARTWVFRHLARTIVLLSPAWFLLFVPGPLSLRLSMIAMAYVTGLYFSLSFMEDSAERRIIRHGYPVGLNRRIREEAGDADRAEIVAMYASWYADRDQA